MTLFFIKLILAHIIGDFVFQSKKWVDHKFTHKHKSKYLYWHILIHAIALLTVLQVNLKAYWLGFILIIVSHYIIDVIKLNLNKKITTEDTVLRKKNKKRNRTLFFIDQLAHFLVLIGVSFIYFSSNFEFETLFSSKTLVFITAILVLTNVSVVVMKIIFSKWNLDHKADTETQDDKDTNSDTASLEEAGTYIGVLERLLVFLFIITNHWEGVGFLIAAKSIFRFGDLSKAKNRKLTEYVLIGTLLSFGIAIITALGYVYLVSIIK